MFQAEGTASGKVSEMEETQHARDQQKERPVWLLEGEHVGMQSGCPQGHGKPAVSSREVMESHTWSASGRSEEGGLGAGNLVGRDGGHWSEKWSTSWRVLGEIDTI